LYNVVSRVLIYLSLVSDLERHRDRVSCRLSLIAVAEVEVLTRLKRDLSNQKSRKLDCRALEQ
jgi:hypothetical protein